MARPQDERLNDTRSIPTRTRQAMQPTLKLRHHRRRSHIQVHAGGSSDTGASKGDDEGKGLANTYGSRNRTQHEDEGARRIDSQRRRWRRRSPKQLAAEPSTTPGTHERDAPTSSDGGRSKREPTGTANARRQCEQCRDTWGQTESTPALRHRPLRVRHTADATTLAATNEPPTILCTRGRRRGHQQDGKHGSTEQVIQPETTRSGKARTAPHASILPSIYLVCTDRPRHEQVALECRTLEASQRSPVQQGSGSDWGQVLHILQNTRPQSDNMLRCTHSVEAETARAIGAAGLNDNADRTHVRIKRNMCSDRRIIGPA